MVVLKKTVLSSCEPINTHIFHNQLGFNVGSTEEAMLPLRPSQNHAESRSRDVIHLAKLIKGGLTAEWKSGLKTFKNQPSFPKHPFFRCWQKGTS